MCSYWESTTEDNGAVSQKMGFVCLICLLCLPFLLFFLLTIHSTGKFKAHFEFILQDKSAIPSLPGLFEELFCPA